MDGFYGYSPPEDPQDNDRVPPPDFSFLAVKSDAKGGDLRQPCSPCFGIIGDKSIRFLANGISLCKNLTNPESLFVPSATDNNKQLQSEVRKKEKKG